jgi:hypothetical protein
MRTAIPTAPFLAPFLALALALASTLACGGGSGSGSSSTAAAAAAITSFSAAQPNLAPGQSTTLTAVFSGGAGTVDQGVGAVTSGAPVTVSPGGTTTYTLTVSGGTALTATTTVTVGSQVVTYANLSGADLGAGAGLNGAIPFPHDNPWNTDISAAPVDPNSANLIASIGKGTGLHPDFGSGPWDGALIGIPYMVVPGTQAKVPVSFQYSDQSDPGPYPIPADVPIEGQPVAGGSFGGDRHVLVLDRDHNLLYELYAAYPQADGSWQAGSGAVFHLDSDDVRPTALPGWTSADAAGLPIFAGLARYDEAAGAAGIRHALRFTVAATREAYVPPATHWASSDTSANLPPMGMRVRLKATYAIPTSFSAPTQALLQAMKTYGMLVADNGSDWFVSGAPDPRWDNDALVSELSQVKGSDFEVVQMEGLVTP